MGSLRSLLFFINLPIIFNLIAPSISQDLGNCTDAAYDCWKCSDTRTYTPGDMYQKNLYNLLFSFSSNSKIAYGFYNSSFGEEPNKVNAIALCRGDLEVDECHTCLNKSINILLQNCSNQKEAIIWSEPCMARYSYNLIFGIKKEDPLKTLPSPHPSDNAEQFNRVLNPLLGILSDRATSGDSHKKFAAGHASVPGGDEIIYAAVQCTPDMDKQNCSSCLKEAVSHIPACCGGRKGARVLKPSCNVRYDDNQFFGSTADSLVNISAPVPSAPAPAPKQGKRKIPTLTIVAIVAPIVVSMALFVVGYCLITRIARKKYNAAVED